MSDKIDQASSHIAALFERTSAGAAELLSREHGLSPRARQLLLLIDGKRDTRRLSRIFSTHELDAYLMVLRTGRFIRAKSLPADPALADALGAKRQKTLVQFLEVTGIAGESFALRVAKCRTWQELHALVPAMASIIEVSRGPGAARQFAEKVFGR